MSIPTLQSVLAQGQLIAPDTFDGFLPVRQNIWAARVPYSVHRH